LIIDYLLATKTLRHEGKKAERGYAGARAGSFWLRKILLTGVVFGSNWGDLLLYFQGIDLIRAFFRVLG
jgi:hypothetical protein